MRRILLFAVLVCLSLFHLANAQSPDPTKPTPEGNVQAAVLIKRVPPKYPKKARQQHVEGAVRIHCIVAKDGSVKDLEVVSGDPLLVDAALKAVRQWRYQPTKLNGQPVDVDTTIDVIFALNKSS